jgi:hypothetical protein
MKHKIAVVLIVAAAACVFFSGWIQFAIPAGKYGVLVSKTGGVNPHPVVPAHFRWQWERLLPTNSKILTFDLTPKTATGTATGTLPSGVLYGKMLEGTPDFSWKIIVSLSGKVSPEKLPVLVRENGIKSQQELDQWTAAQMRILADEAGTQVITDLLSKPENVAKIASGAETVSALISAKLLQHNGKGMDIIDCTVTDAEIPDMALYAVAEKTYAEYQKARNDLFARTAAAEASSAVSEYLQIERFSRWGELLTKYPILIDFFAVAKDESSEAFKAVRSLKKND